MKVANYEENVEMMTKLSTYQNKHLQMYVQLLQFYIMTQILLWYFPFRLCIALSSKSSLKFSTDLSAAIAFHISYFVFFFSLFHLNVFKSIKLFVYTMIMLVGIINKILKKSKRNKIMPSQVSGEKYWDKLIDQYLKGVSEIYR